MSDELECFRKAAELGCPDFKEICGNFLMFKFLDDRHYQLPRACQVVDDQLRESNSRINRYAAAVCAEWWNDRLENDVRHEPSNGFPTREAMECREMIDCARAFGKKYGGVK